MRNKIIKVFLYFSLILFLSMSASVMADRGLKEFQKQRLLVFLNPELKPLTSGYNTIQSIIAIGSGGAVGKGYLKGSQTQLDFIPQQVNDFIFTNIAEEWGLFGSTLVLIAFLLILYRSARVAYHAKDRLGGLIVAGIVSMIMVHVLVNIGMVSGIMPTTGIPLPFVTAGGSSLFTFCAGIGLIFNVEIRRFVHI